MATDKVPQSEQRMLTLRAIHVSVPDLGATRLELQAPPGIHVLYGLNGVGKTRILNSIQHGAFSLHAPMDAGDYWSPIWNMYRAWSFGHEHELEWPYKDDALDEGTRPGWITLDVVDIVEKDPDTLLEVLYGLKDLALNDTRYRGAETTLPFHWVARLAYWVARIHHLGDKGVRLVREAILEFIEQGDVVVHPLGAAESDGRSRTWSVTHYATITPDSPRLYAWQQWAAGAIQETAYRSWAEGPYRHWEDCVGEPGWDSHECRLIPDAASAAVPPPPGAEPFVHDGPRFEVFSRTIDFAERPGHWHGFSPIVFINDDYAQLDNETLAYLRLTIDTSEEFASTDPPDEYSRDPSRNEALDEFMFGSTISPKVDPAVQRYAGEIGDLASSEFALLLSTATPLRARIVEPGEWAVHGRMRWESMDRRGSWVPLSDLSDTQRRLATLAIKIAMHAPSDAVSILLIDEPERGLHRIAERHLVAGLDDLTRRYPDLVVIVASHSPSFLRPDLGTLHHVERDSEGVVQLNRMPAIPGRDLDKLGMSASDLLQLTRIVILVEGQHDEWVLRHTFGDEFDAMGVKVMSMRGATRLISAADGTLLFDYTEAHLIVMLDRTKQDRIDRHWNDALVKWKESHSIADVAKILGKLLPVSKKRSPDRVDGETEGAALRDFCTAVIRQGRHDRISFAGMEADDIEDYFSPAFFTTRDDPPASFKVLRNEWRKLKGAGEEVGSFKNWARQKHDVRFTERNFKRAVKNSDLHPDFQALFRMVSDLSDLLA